MEPRLQDLKKSLDITVKEVRMIGIKGMGGAGKTTLARGTFDSISTHFEAKTFVENVREVSNTSLSGFLSLQRQILSDLLNGEGNNISSVHEGTHMMRTKLRGRKVLVVLDDVDHKDQLEALAGDLNWFKPGSRIIITTRDEQVLIAHKVKWIHSVKLLSNKEAILLFSRHAFGEDIPTQQYEVQSLEVVRYAAGLPLTIKVLGSFLCGKDKPEWIDALSRLKEIPLKETIEKLELSFESLENDYKEIFLDVACLLKGWEKNKAIGMLESCGFYARNGLKVLEQRSLITFRAKHFDVYLSMHHHIEEMGKNIVRRLHPKEPHHHSRLWIQREIKHVLHNELGTEATQCIKMKLTPEIVGKGLRNMKKLRCLIINCDDLVKNDKVSQYLPNALQYLNWHNYPHRCLPKTFRANNLVGLDMRWSSIEQLWKRGKVMEKLKFVDLSFSNMKTLNIGLTPNLVWLDLQSCFDLVELYVPIGSLEKLVYLDLGQCESLKSFSFIKELESLEVLNLNGLHLTEFPDIIPSHFNNSLKLLNFCDNDIEYLHSSIGNLHKLVSLYLNGCENLKSLPESICSLQHLKVLDLQGCGMEELPENIGQLEGLEKLDLTSSKVKQLPDSICMLKHLKTLLLQECKVLDKLPEELGRLESLEELNLKFCNIRRLPTSICKLKPLKTLILVGCGISKLPDDFGQIESLNTLLLSSSKIIDIPSSICKLKHLKYLDLSFCSELEKLPENLGDLERLETLNLGDTKIRELPSSICKLKHLKVLKLSRCYELEKLPDNLGDLEGLEELNLRDSRIRDLPSSICNLKHLEYLDLSMCYKLETLPENLGDLKCLEMLDLTATSVSYLPHNISC